jgi:hypothetical protein
LLSGIIGGIVGGVIGGITGAITGGVGGAIVGAVAGAVAGAVTGATVAKAQSSSGSSAGTVSSVGSIVVSTLQNAYESVGNYVSNLFQPVVNTVSTVVRSASNAAGTIAANDYIDYFENQMQGGRLSLGEQAVVSDAIREMKALQTAGAGVAQVKSAYITTCTQRNKAKEQTQAEIVETYASASEQDWLFLTSGMLNGMTDYQRVYISNTLKKNEGAISFDDLVKLGLYTENDWKVTGPWFSRENVPENFIYLIELEYRLIQNGTSFALLDAQDRAERAATQTMLLAMAGYKLINGLMYGPSGVVFNLNSRFDSTEALGYTVTDGKVPLPGGMTGMADGTLPEMIMPEEIASRQNIKIGNINDLPSNAKYAYEKYDESGWRGNFSGQTPGTAAGSKFNNTNGYLPTTDVNGNPITYREFDINNRIPELSRDAERFVMGSDGSVYYTDSHYGQGTSSTGLPPFLKVR